MNKKQRVEKLKAAVFSDDWETQKRACNQLFHFGGRFNKTSQRKLRHYLVSLFDQDNVNTRNAVALVVRENHYQPALRPLLRALQKPENSRSRMTLAYALENLNCGQHLGELFEIVFGAADNYVALLHLLSVLEEQIFEFTRAELEQIAKRWEEIKPTWDDLYNQDKGTDDDKAGEEEARGMLPIYAGHIEFDQETIQDLVDWYLAYLE